MAYPIRVFCSGCPCVCYAAPLTAEDLSRLLHEDREVFEAIVYLKNVYIYCLRDATYKLFILP